MAKVKNQREIEIISGLAEELSEILRDSLRLIEPGITTKEIDTRIESTLAAKGLNGPCKGYYGYPAVSCISVNDQVTHGIPDDTVIKEGDIVDIDLVIERNGFFADMSRTIGVGNISVEAARLIKATEEALQAGIAAVRPKTTLGDIGFAIQQTAEQCGYQVVRDYCGHFIGRAMHEEPLVPNTGKKGKGKKLEAGMIFCIEPMINAGSYQVVTRGWDARTIDGQLSSRCEHMVLVTPEGCRVLTSFLPL